MAKLEIDSQTNSPGGAYYEQNKLQYNSLGIRYFAVEKSSRWRYLRRGEKELVISHPSFFFSKEKCLRAIIEAGHELYVYEEPTLDIDKEE